MVHPEWSGFSTAVKYLQRPRYTRTGPSAVVDSEVEGVAFREELQDTNPGEATLRVQVTSRTNLSLAGAFFCFDLPDANWAGARCRLEGTAGEPSGELRFETGESEASGRRAREASCGGRQRWGQSR